MGNKIIITEQSYESVFLSLQLQYFSLPQTGVPYITMVEKPDIVLFDCTPLVSSWLLLLNYTKGFT